MFLHLTSRLRGEVATVQKALVMADGVRNLLTNLRASLLAVPPELSEGADDKSRAEYGLATLLPQEPGKRDWQIYDHCAALTRLYSVYEQFIGELVGEYVRLLPKLYVKYSDLPACVANQHRIGIGHILLKIGEKGPYKDLDEDVVVRELAAGLSGASGYSLLTNAFFIDRQNLRFSMLCTLLGQLGLSNCGGYINRHFAIANFIKDERAGNSSAEKELQDFIEYRNEAAHRKVDNVIGLDAIAAIGRFLVALGEAISDLVEEGILRRRMELGILAERFAWVPQK